MSDNMNVLVVGAGYMGKEHTKVLMAQGITPTVICRSKETAEKFKDEIGIIPLTGGVEHAIAKLKTIPTHAVVAVNVDQLAIATKALIRFGIKNLLVEKPAAINKDELDELVELVKEADSRVYVAYNRRFYASTEKAIDVIKADGGVSSFNFEFTEWGYRIEASSHPQKVKDEWVNANSSHVIDLAFFLGGKPEEMKSFVAGSLPWHTRAAQYAGAGRTKNGALFSYQANWDAPGRWVIEILTKEHRLYFKPMEKLAIQNRGSVAVEEVPIDDELDTKFKPGLYNQMKAFLTGEKHDRLMSIEEQDRHMQLYKRIECIE